MSFRRAGQCAAIILGTLLWMSCGQVYRPVVIPCSAGSIPGCPTVVLPAPANFHEVFALSTNVPFYPGSAMQIDVSGDSIVAETSNNPEGANVGPVPTYGAILPNFGTVFVTSAGSLNSGVSDIVSSFSPAFDTAIASGFGTVSTFSLAQWPCSYLPDFVATSQNTAVYVANYGVESNPSCVYYPGSTDSVASLNLTANTVSDIAYLPAGSHPVALAETPDAQNLYVVNQGNNTVTDLSPTDMSTITTIPIANTPAWEVLRSDGLRLYVVTQGDGNLYTIRTDTNVLVGAAQPVGGAGANYAVYDGTLNRLYVINPNVAKVFVFDASTDPPTPIGGAGGVTIPAPAVTGVGPVIPTSVAALADGTRFYVASYVVATGACPDPNTSAVNCIIPQATVFDAATFTVKTTVFPLLSPSSTGTQPYAVAPVATCAPVTPYVPGATRFRMSSAASIDSSRVYVAICDAGSVADITTTTNPNSAGASSAIDTLVLDLEMPFTPLPAGSNSQPPTENPIFLFAGQ